MQLTGSLLECPIPAATQQRIVESLWDSADYETLRPYFQYYTEQCRMAFHVHGRKFPAKTHQDVLKIASSFQNGSYRQLILQDLIETCNNGIASDSPETFESFIDLAVRLILMLDIGELRNAFSGRKRLIWSEASLQDFVGDIFSDRITLGHEGVKLGMSFTARNLDRMTGFRVELTTNLADHLRLRHEDRTVSIFHHASFLQCQKNNSLFPAGLIEETLRTLALLFTQGDRKTNKWYCKQLQGNPEELDLGVLKCGHLRDNYRQIEKYVFWHDRLVILKEAFDEPQAKTISQLWNDRREGNQWYALWVAIGLTLFFGLVQSIEGGLQVYKAYNPSS